MKNALFIILFFGSFASLAQTNPKADSIYYLIDIAKIPDNARMWVIYKDDLYTRYTLQCPCLKFNGKPTFFHETRDKGQIITEAQLKAIKLISLSKLILRSKAFLDNNATFGSVSFFFIEPNGKNYVIRQEVAMNPEIQIVSGQDVMKNPPDNSAFEKPGLITIAAKDVGKYVNKSVITSGHIVNTKIEPDNTTLLYVGADYPNQNFIILIGSKDRHDFDLPDFYSRKKDIKVTGKVIEYKGHPAIVINNENQLQLKTN